jgi:hypothetical protein
MMSLLVVEVLANYTVDGLLRSPQLLGSLQVRRDNRLVTWRIYCDPFTVSLRGSVGPWRRSSRPISPLTRAS